MNSQNHIISAVDQVIEPPTLWTERLSKSKFGARIPHIERSADGVDRWFIDGRAHALAQSADVGALLPDRGATAKQWEDIPNAAYDPVARLKAMDEDGIGHSVLYPSLAGISGERFGALADPELALACVQAYNDWLIDEWMHTSNRFIPQCVVPLSPIDATVAEIRRAVGRGHRGVIFPAAPMQLGALPHINDADYDPLWAACQELEVPLCFRAGSTPELFQFPMPPNLAPELAAAMQSATRSASARVRSHQHTFLSHSAALSQAQSRFRREHHRLGHILTRICRSSIRARPLRLSVETIGNVSSPMLSDRLV